MTIRPRFGVLQLDLQVGDVPANCDAIVKSMDLVDADLLVTSELALVGYPPSDYCTTMACQLAVTHALNQIASATLASGKAILVGAPLPNGSRLTNSMVLVDGGQIVAQWDKQLLPFYDVFDDPRWFCPGRPAHVIEWRGVRLGVLICEDAWAEFLPGCYAINPVEQLQQRNPDWVIVPTASPFEIDKHAQRVSVMAQLARQLHAPVLSVNQVGYQDDIVFDGASMYLDDVGVVRCQFPQFQMAIGPVTDSITAPYTGMAQVAQALRSGISGYVRKTGFKTVVLGLSGGIDSAVTATLAVDALGADAVTGLALPTQFSSSDSFRDANQLAATLGIQMQTIEIQPIYNQIRASLGWSEFPVTVAMENLQSRIRGTVVMATANATGGLALSTGNKSELAMGYCTLYGDMNGALAPLSDLYKSQVVELANWINRDTERIPVFTMTRPPSAELRPDQTDADSLPPYPVLDAILKDYLENRLTESQLIDRGHHPDLVRDVIRRCQLNEYKRRQAAPGIKLSRYAFGRGRRMPIVAKMKEC